MLEGLKYFLDTLASMTGDITMIAAWLAGGYLFVKLFVFSATTYAVVVIVNKLSKYIYEAYLEKLKAPFKPEFNRVVDVVELEGLCITADGTYDKLLRLLKRARLHRNRNQGYKSEYIHMRDVEWLTKVIEKEIEKDEKAEE